MQPGGYYYEAYSFCAAEHGGTHLDAPIHFAAQRWTADAIPLERMIGPAILVDVSRRAAGSRDYLVSVADLRAWEREHGPIPDGAIVLLRTGHGAYWSDPERYLGTAERGAAAAAKLHFPGLDPAAARWLVGERRIHAIGLDTPSIDAGPSTDFLAHRILLDANIPVFENVAGLEKLPALGFTVVALPMKIGRGSGGPLRIVALIPKPERSAAIALHREPALLVCAAMWVTTLMISGAAPVPNAEVSESGYARGPSRAYPR